MAHKNISQRQDKVKSLLVDGTLTSAQVIDLAQEFGCSKSAIRQDIIYFRHGQSGGYHVSQKVRRLLRNKFQDTCQYCEKKTDKPIVEHIVPAAQGGKATMGNLTLACQSCNTKKRFVDGTTLIR